MDMESFERQRVLCAPKVVYIFILRNCRYRDLYMVDSRSLMGHSALEVLLELSFIIA